MPDVTDLLLRLAEPPLAPPDAIETLEHRVRRRRRRRRATRATLAVACVVAVAAPAALIVAGRSATRPVSIATQPAQPSTPEHPAGRFLPTWLPGTMRIATEQEYLAFPAQPAGRFRTFIRRGPQPIDGDSLTISLQDGAPALDIDTAVARYPGAARRDVQGRPALYLPTVSARSGATLVWSAAPGRLAQVTGVGVTESELASVAGGFQLPPRLDATPVPLGFAEVTRNDTHAYPPPVPLRFTADTRPLQGSSVLAEAPWVSIGALWDAVAPAGQPTAPVRGHPAVKSKEGTETTLWWTERPGLMVSVTGTKVSIDDIRRVAVGLREQSVEEVLGRPTGEKVVLARGEAGGTPYELRTHGGPSGPCLELAHGGLFSSCSSDPAARVADFTLSIGGGMAFGPVVAEATSVRLELAGGQSVEAVTVGRDAGQGAAFYVVALPPEASRVEAVVALGAGGQVLRRTPVA